VGLAKYFALTRALKCAFLACDVIYGVMFNIIYCGCIKVLMLGITNQSMKCYSTH